MTKKIIALLLILTIVGVVIVAINVVNWGALTIAILERSTNLEIKYESIEGSIFKGFKIHSYCMKISATDSICGNFAEINYRLSLLRLGLPSLFEVSLIDPAINIKKKAKTTGGSPGLSYPKLSLGIRINVKNGKIIYEDARTYIIERISGLIFVDFVGSKLYLSTMNLSLSGRDFPVSITSANVSFIIDQQSVQAKTLVIKGTGFSIDGQGYYHPDENHVKLNFRNLNINFDDMKIGRGKVRVFGDIDYRNGKFKSNLRGSGSGIYGVDAFKFETNSFGDTTLINIFEGQLFEGTFSAQIKGRDINDWQLETNFKSVRLDKVWNLARPMMVSGYLGYRHGVFAGCVNSPPDSGLGVDSLYVFGRMTKSLVFLDSLYIDQPFKSLFIQGKVYPDCSLNVTFDHFNLERISALYSMKGIATGSGFFLGDRRDLENFTLTADVKVESLSFRDVYVQRLQLKTLDFKMAERINFASLNLKDVAYKKFNVDSVGLLIQEGGFQLSANRKHDDISIQGKLNEDGTGVVENFLGRVNKTSIKNSKAIEFDLFKLKISEFSFEFLGGTLYGTLVPRNVNLVACDLEQLGKLLGLRVALSGTTDLKLAGDSIGVNARGVNFLGLKNGSISLDGAYRENALIVKRLYAVDDNGQELDLSGSISASGAKASARFSDLHSWILPFLKNIVTNPDCSATGNIDFTGNFNDFKMFGSVVIEDGCLGLPVISALVDSISMNLKFDGNRILFESGRGWIYSSLGSITSGAPITGGGVVKLEPKFKVRNLNFDFSFKDAPIQYMPYAYGIGSGNFTLLVENEITHYKGNITVKEGIVPIDFGAPVIVEESQKGKDNWRMNIKISGERNIWLRNRDADIEFGGDIYIIKEEEPLYLSGTLETKRGNYYWLNHTLKITTGKVVFYPEEKIDPQLDLWAEMDTRERDPNSGQEIKIILHCFGPISEPIFEFYSEPPIYNEQDIITYMNLNITWSELESLKEGDYVGKVLPQSLLAWLESDVSRRIREYTGLDYFRIDAPLFEPDEKTKLTVGKYISRDLFITYTYDITTFSNEFNVEYFIDDRNEILIKRDDEGEYSLQYQYRIRF